MSYERKIANDGLPYLAISSMNPRYDPETGLEIKQRDLKGLEIVHARDIADFYGLDIADVGLGDNRVLGTWTLVHLNLIGQRVPFNNEDAVPDDRNVRDWKVLKDSMGKPIDTKEIIKSEATTRELDDGMYVRVADLRKFAKAQGWRKGGGLPETARAAVAEDRMARLETLVANLIEVVTVQASKK